MATYYTTPWMDFSPLQKRVARQCGEAMARHADFEMDQRLHVLKLVVDGGHYEPNLCLSCRQGDVRRGM